MLDTKEPSGTLIGFGLATAWTWIRGSSRGNFNLDAVSSRVGEEGSVRARSTPAISVISMLAICGGAAAQVCIQPAFQVGPIEVELQPVLRQALGAPIFEPRAWDHARDGTGRIFYIEQIGTLHIIQNGQVLPQACLDISSRLSYFEQRGLLGFILHKDFANPAAPGYQLLYTWHCEPRNSATPDYALAQRTHQIVLTEWKMSTANPNVVNLASERQLLRLDHGSPVHSAGGMAWGPDGYLYLTVGTPSNQPMNGQTNEHPDGSMLRIDPLHPTLTPGSTDPISRNGKYRIPADNPFAGSQTLAQEIFAYGLRHPYQMSIDQQTGVILAADVGQASFEEINVVVKGGNYGWPYLEANCTGLFELPDPPPVLIPPIVWWDHTEGRAATGAMIYRGSIQALRGKMIVSDLTLMTGGFYRGPGRLFYADIFDSNGQVLPPSQVTLQELRLTTGALPLALVALTTDPDGELYLFGVDYPNVGASIYKVTGPPTGCYPDCDQTTGPGVLDIFDFLCFSNAFANNDPYACDCDTSTGPGVCDIFDFLCFGSAFSAGCP